MYRLLFLLVLPFVHARNIIMLGDSITMDMYQFDFHPFESTDIVNNYARAAFGIELVRLIIDPERDLNRLNIALTENTNTNSYSSLDVIVPNIENNPPDIISMMIGLRDVFDGLSNNTPTSIIINNYKFLLDRIEQLVPPNTIVLINTVIPADNTGYNDFYRDILFNKIREFNSLLKLEIDNRDILDYRFVDLFDSFLKNGRTNPDLFLAQGEHLLHPSLSGYKLWKQKINTVLFENTSAAVAYIKTNHWDGKTHRNFFQLFINDKHIGSFLETSSIIQEFTLTNEKIYKIEVVMSTW